MFLMFYHAFICVFTCLYTYLPTCLHVTPYVLVFFRALIAFDVAKGGEITTSGISVQVVLVCMFCFGLYAMT